jgi:hypothetical protein
VVSVDKAAWVRSLAVRFALMAAALALSVGGIPRTALADPRPVPPPQPANVTPRLTMTYYYYWYDAATQTHLREADGQRYHFPTTPTVSWSNVAWHQKQLKDMSYAGIDVVLPVYWGHDKPTDNWSWQGLPYLVQAWESQKAAGQHPPSIGLFLDTTIVDWRDLTTQAGHDWLYAQFHDYFSAIPKDAWAVINGRPIAYLFTSDWTAAMNQATFDDLSSRFQADFGVAPYIVHEVSWDYPILGWNATGRVWDATRPIHTDSRYLWGAALHGYVDYGDVAAVGPGYDDHLVPGRGSGTIVDRQGGMFYEYAFWRAIQSHKTLLVIETWDEMHEGSSIAETVEYGRTYLDLTRALTAMFHAAT